MKKALLCLLILVLLPVLSPAQEFWQKTNGPDGGKIHSMGIRYFMEGIFAGTADSGLYRSDDYGDNWIKTSLRDTLVTSIQLNSIGQIFAGTADSGLFIADNDGDSWIQTDIGLKNCSVRSMAINSAENIFLGTADSGIFRSMGMGLYWTKISNGQTEYGAGVVAALDCYSSGHVYAGINVNHNQTTVGYAFHSVDNGDTWPDTVLVGSAITSLAAAPTGLVYAGTREDGVFRSSDYGKSWTPVNSGLTDLHIGPVITNELEHVFAATDSGVYRSVDYGNHWTRTDGLQGVKVAALVNNYYGHIFAGTDDGFMYRNIESTNAVEKTGRAIPSSFSLKQNYPNPFNPATNIEFNIPAAGFVSLKVYNVTGKEVAALINRELSAGNHRLVWKPGNIAGGVYFCQIVTAEFRDVKKMILLR